MFRFTIRDVLWLTMVVALSVALWVNHQRYVRQIEAMTEEARQIKKESKIWETRAQTLRDDMMIGTNKNTDIEFIPGGIRYTAKKNGSSD